MPRHVPRHDALLDRPRGTLKVADRIDELEGLPQILPSARRLERDEFPVIADVIVDCLMPDQFCARLFDQRNETIFQPVHFLRPELDRKIGKTLQMPDASACAVARLEDRHILARSDKTIRRGQSGRASSDDDHG